MDTNRAEIQRAANLIEACDYWAKAASQTLELHAVARTRHTSALDILRGNTRAMVVGSQDAAKCGELAINIRVLYACVAGALLRPAGSRLQPQVYRDTGAHLVENESSFAAGILPVLKQRRAAAMDAKLPATYADYVTRSAMEFAPGLNALSLARARGAVEGAGETALRLVSAGGAASPGVEAAAAAMAACAGLRPESAAAFASSGLADYIALESAALVLEQEFARRRESLVTKERELRASETAERAARNQRHFDRTQGGVPSAGGTKGLNDVLGIRRDGQRQVAEQG